jgi:membrane protein DedA with SNARE-associated domain
MRIHAAIAVLAVLALAHADPAAAQAAVDGAVQATDGSAQAAAPEATSALREWGTRLVEYGPVAIFVAFVISGIGLHLSEDFILVPAGIFAYEQYVQTGSWEWFIQASVAAWLGIVAGDAGWIWICRHFGGKLLGWKKFRRLIGPRTLLEFKYEMDRRGAVALLIARFIPGARTPMVTMSGLMQLSWWKILAVEAAGVLITAPLQIGIGVGVAKIGSQFESAAHRWMLYIGATLAVVALMGVVHVLISRRRSKHRPPRAPMRWLSGFATKVAKANPLRKVRA